MCGNKHGFSLLEILVAIAIVAVMATILIPRLQFKGARELDLLIDKLVVLTASGHERALLTGKVHRLFFSLKEGSFVELQVAQDKKAAETETRFERAPSDYQTVFFEWPERFQIKNFYIKGFDEAAQGTLKDAWFYLLPSGISQEIIINILDTESGDEAGLVLNPFHVKFTRYDTFQKP